MWNTESLGKGEIAPLFGFAFVMTKTSALRPSTTH